MAGGTFTFNGIGTTLYGNRDAGPDGSYVTTEWVVFVYVPVFPLRSWRVLPTGKGTSAIVYNSASYQRVQVPLNGHQVRNGYAVTLAVVAVFVGLYVWG
ncbi:MAG: hypothetical protein EXR78_09630 [Deltaproteobacteria bacterium]|nr:hypothetical protein [Deltaproteobacteria bacterium]